MYIWWSQRKKEFKERMLKLLTLVMSERSWGSITSVYSQFPMADELMKWIPRFTETKSKSAFLFRTCGWGEIIITFRFGFLLSKRSELPSTTHGNDNVTQRTSLKERKDRNITYELYVTSNSRLKVGMRGVAARMRVCCLCTYRKTDMPRISTPYTRAI
jgi:hypothetical protein